MDSSNDIIPDLNIINDNSFALYDNIRDLILFENQINCQYNWPLITVIVLAILSYIQSKQSNLIQGVNT